MNQLRQILPRVQLTPTLAEVGQSSKKRGNKKALEPKLAQALKDTRRSPQTRDVLAKAAKVSHGSLDKLGALYSAMPGLLEPRAGLPDLPFMIAAKLLPMLEEEARGKQREGGLSAGRGRPKVVASLPQPIDGEPAPKSRDIAAAMAGATLAPR